jgi:phosphoribosylpyrophosphate synthetase
MQGRPLVTANQESGGATIFSGSANIPLAEAVAAAFGSRLGERSIGRFPDGEVSITIDETVRRRARPLPLPGAHEKLADVERVFVTDSLPQTAAMPRVQVVPVAPLLATAIQRIVAAGSLGWVE